MHRRRSLAWLALALATGASLLAATPAAAQPPPSDVPTLTFERYKLDNGMEVILHPDRAVPLVAVSVWYHVGSGCEVPGKSGFAHLFEHMMFQGSRHTGEDVHFDILREIGASSVNGTTNSDRTNYFEVVPAASLEVALWLESDRMGYMLDLLNEKSLANQRDVVRNERRQRYDNVAYGKDRFAVNAALYPEGHPYRYLTIGRHEDLEAASLEDVTAFFKAWYTPSNATLALAGDFDVATAKALIERWFGTFPRLDRASPTPPPTPSLSAPVRTEVEDGFARLRRLHFAWHSPARLAEGDDALALAASVLGSTGWGRLEKRLILELKLARTVAVYQSGAQFSGVFHIVVDLNPDADAARVEQLVMDEVKALGDTPVAPADLNRSVNRIESSFIWGLDPVLSRAEQLQYFNHYTGDPGYTANYLANLRKQTPDDVQRAARTWLTRPHALIITRPAAPEKQP